MTTCFASRPFPSSSNMSISMWPDESQVFLLPVACVCLFLHCPASSRQHKRTPHLYNIPPINAWKKSRYLHLSKHCFPLIIEYLLPSAHFSLLHYSLFTIHNGQLAIHYPQFITHYQFIFHYQRRQRALFHALSPLRPTSPSACDLIRRKFFNCLSRVFRFFIVLLRHIHTTPSNQRVKKTQLSTHPFC